MEILRRQLDELIAELEDETQLKEKLENLVSVYPFNEFEYIIATLLGSGKLTLDQYVAGSKYFSDRQHRGNVGEGQLHLTRENIDEFASYEVNARALLQAIRDAFKRQMVRRRAQ